MVKPAWIVHPDESPSAKPQTIFTCAIHPDGSRLATGGLDNKIRLWATLPILNPKAEHDEERVPKLLCTLTSHSGQSRVCLLEMGCFDMRGERATRLRGPELTDNPCMHCNRSRHVRTVVE